MESRVNSLGIVPGSVSTVLQALLVSLLAIAGLLAGFHSAALAHGGTLRVKGAEAGAYRVWVWTRPSPPRAGRLHTSVLVMHPEAGTVLDAAVEFSLKPIRGQGKPSAALAIVAEGGANIQHHADLEFSEGFWQVTLEVKGKLGSGRTGFELEVEP